ncbi:MAG: FliM/FliN family flagellar motor switch protein [Candidatus Margulisbacteria bacterium]|nr:FliM/FliN family flagellar motor switch protein [Candidatus Margulisiibacteriota bacterium]MBU1616992.1 FliM/FliN family flagellar motor switch protein [Candidatus Margulisiibacteriota bacterium]
MADRAKTEISSQKISIKLPPAIGDWTTYRPAKTLGKKVKSGLFGFDRLAKHELNLFLKIHYHFMEAMFLKLRRELGIGIEFYSCWAEQTTYLNFLRTLSGHVAQLTLNIPGIHENIQAIIDLGVANSIVNHSMGSRDLEPLGRGLTEAEGEVLKIALANYLPLFAREFGQVFNTPELSLLSSPDIILDPAVNPTSTFISFSADVSFNDNPTGRIVFGYQAATAKTLIKLFESREFQKELNIDRLPNAILRKISIPISATLGETTLSPTDLDSLEPGDVIALDTSIKSAIIVKLGQHLRLLAQAGNLKAKKAIRLVGFEEDEVVIMPPLAIDSEEEQEPANEVETMERPEETAQTEETTPVEHYAEEPVQETIGTEDEFSLTDEDLKDSFAEDELEETGSQGSEFDDNINRGE